MWLNAETGERECWDMCDDEDCRTLVVGSKEYEVSSSEPIVKARSQAASKTGNSCCGSTSKSSNNCCD